MRRIILILVLSSLLSAFRTEEPAVVRGKITSALTGEPLAGVTIQSGQVGTSSNPDGSYTLSLPAGTHDLSVKLLSFREENRKINLKPGETITLNFALADQSKELGTVVISASRFEQNIEEVTVSMEVIKPYFITNTATTNMEQPLEQAPGVNIVDGQANIRGGSGWSYGAGSRVQVLVDDLPMLTADANDTKWSFLPAENINQVEIIKGASSVLFGSSALNGVINLRTAFPGDIPKTSILWMQGVYGGASHEINGTEYRLDEWRPIPPLFGSMSFLHSRKIGQVDLVVGGNVFIDEGYRQGESEQRGRFNTNFRYRFRKIQGLSAGVNINMMLTDGTNFFVWKNDREGAYQPAENTLSDYRTYRTNIDPFLTYVTASGNSHKIRTRYFNSTNENNTNQDSDADMFYGEYQYQHHFDKHLVVTAGLSSTLNKVNSQMFGVHDGSQKAIYFQADASYGRWNLSAGGRAEQYEVDEMEATWAPVFRTGVNYKAGKATFLRGSFGQGYRFPSIAELFVRTNVGSLVIYPNDSLEPEKGWSAELGVRQGFPIGKWGAFADLAVFDNRYFNMMEFAFAQWGTVSDPLLGNGFRSVNVGDTRIRGAEITLTGTGEVGHNKTLTLFGGYTYIDPRQLTFDSTYVKKLGYENYMGSDSSDVLKYRYRHTFKLDAELNHPHWMLGASIRYMSFMENIDKIFVSGLFDFAFPGFGVKEYRESHEHGDAVVDLRTGWKFASGLKASVIVKNLLNNAFMQRPADMQMPRQFIVQLSADF